jgi:DNA-binding PadR family transcriptional regulator
MNAGNAKYITIYEWMNELDLSPVEKIAYALVYSFCKKGECFNGKNSYLQEWIGCSKQTLINTMTSLEEKGLIVKQQEMVNGRTVNMYTLGVKKLDRRGLKIRPEGSKIWTLGVKKLDPYNNIDINNDNISSSKKARAHAYEEVLGWITDNEEGLEIMLMRNGLISYKTPLEEMIEIIRPYAKEYYEQQQMNGGDDIQRRGRRDIKQHFSQWLPIRIKKEQQQKQKDNETSTDPITRAMQDFATGWDNAERTGGL